MDAKQTRPRPPRRSTSAEKRGVRHGANGGQGGWRHGRAIFGGIAAGSDNKAAPPWAGKGPIQHREVRLV
jgi:hypothetical protein